VFGDALMINLVKCLSCGTWLDMVFCSLVKYDVHFGNLPVERDEIGFERCSAISGAVFRAESLCNGLDRTHTRESVSD